MCPTLSLKETGRVRLGHTNRTRHSYDDDDDDDDGDDVFLLCKGDTKNEDSRIAALAS